MVAILKATIRRTASLLESAVESAVETAVETAVESAVNLSIRRRQSGCVRRMTILHRDSVYTFVTMRQYLSLS